MRSAVSLAKSSLAVLLLLGFVLSSLTACLSPGVDGTAATVVAAESTAASAKAELPASSPAGPDPCTPERPCQHVPEPARGVEHALGRTGATFCDAVQTVSHRDLGPHHPLERVAPTASTSSPVPPVAVRAPVAALCVDRN